MSEALSTYLRFEVLISKLLLANGFKIQHLPDRAIDHGFDFLATLNGDTWAVEVKFYRTARAQMSLLESAAARLTSHVINNPALKGMLIVSCLINDEYRAALEEKYGLVLIDRSHLYNWAEKLPNAADELNAFLEEQYEFPLQPHRRELPELLSIKRRPIASPPTDTIGTSLAEELQVLTRGKKSWAGYEKLCDRVLRYLFSNDLYGWHAQKRTDDGLNRFDYICRIRPTTDFWRFLIDHLNSRYILFEFKNYTGLVKQGQILTTEKYLLEKGLRRVAIIMSRAGADKGAITMTQGAMREHGKLMLVLDDLKVQAMLRMKERGEDPTDLLFDATDDFLLSLPR